MIPIEMQRIAMSVLESCERCDSDERFAAVAKCSKFGESGLLAICGYCYRELMRLSLGQII
jgi:hypothetical protein